MAQTKTKFMNSDDVDKIINSPGPSKVKDNTPRPVQGAALIPADLSRDVTRMKGILLLDPAQGSDLIRARLFSKLRVAGEGSVEVVLPDGTVVLENTAAIQQLICFMPAYQTTVAFEQNDKLDLIGKMSQLNAPVEIAEKKDTAAAKVLMTELKTIEEKMQAAKNPPAASTFAAVSKAYDIALMRYDAGQRFYREKWMTSAEYTAQRTQESGTQAH